MLLVIVVVIAVLIGTLQVRFPGYLATGVWYVGYGEPWRTLVNALLSTNFIKVSIDQRSIIVSSDLDPSRRASNRTFARYCCKPT